MTTSPPVPGSGRLPVFGVLALALAAGLGLLTAQYVLRPPAPNSTEQIALEGSLLYPAGRPIPGFSLQRADGSVLDQTALAGRWTLLFIGFTHCPDVCPTTLALLAEVHRQWPNAGGSADAGPAPAVPAPSVLFVAVDAERDTPAKAQEYASFFHPDFVGASGTPEQLEAFTRNLGLVFMKTPLEGEQYTIDHSSSLAIINPEGQLAGVMRPPLDARRIAADMRTLAAHWAKRAGAQP